MTTTISIEAFEQWINQQGTIIAKFNSERHPLSLWLNAGIVTREKWVEGNDIARQSLWCLDDAPETVLPSWAQYICSRTFHKPYGVPISKDEVQDWLRHWRADQA